MKLIGGEMADWSDRGDDSRPPVRGPVLAEILRRVVPGAGRVLIAGPHDDSLVDALHPDAEVVFLVRAEPDARRLADLGATVRCGTLAKITEVESYDVVVALDGLDRLCSVEGAQLDWAAALQVLEQTLRPGGSLLLAVENELGVHRLVDRAAPTSAHGLADWRPVGEFDETKPGNPTRLAAALSTDGLAVSWLAAAWPVPSEPTLLATPNALQDGPVGALSAAAAGATGSAYAGKPVLSDPRRLAAAAVRGGLGAEFAASWIVLAHRAPRPTLRFNAPVVLLGDGPVVEFAPGADGGWVRTVIRGAAGRDTSRLDGPLPQGRLLEELLLAACLRHDLRACRRLLTGWAQSAEPDAFDNVLVGGAPPTDQPGLGSGAAGFARLDPSRSCIDRTVAVRRFAETLLTGGYAHPWASATDVESLTIVLTAAAGIDDLPAATTHPAPHPRRSPLAPDVSPSLNLPLSLDLPLSLREREEELRRLREQLADADTRARWLENELSGRDAELRRARMQIKAFSGKFSYRVARLGAVGARKALRRLRKDS